MSGNLRDRTRVVRAELRRCVAFVEVRRGRWTLGESSPYEAAGMTLPEIADYQKRLHKNAQRRSIGAIPA
jgi:hypothetical protein